MEISYVDTPSISGNHTSPNKKLIEEMKKEAMGNSTLLDYQKSFLLREIDTTMDKYHLTKVNRCISPDEGLDSIENVTMKDFTSLRDKYHNLKNHFFQLVWRDIILPNMNSESFYDFISKMEMYELGEEFVPIMCEWSESFKSHQEEIEEMIAQTGADGLNEGF